MEILEKASEVRIGGCKQALKSGQGLPEASQRGNRMRAIFGPPTRYQIAKNDDAVAA
jgi:hypothetical protein